MRWANFFHFYQPADQQADILEAIVRQSYKPLLAGFEKNRRIKLTLNVSGALLELFDKHRYLELLDILRRLGKDGRIEFTSSAKYHAFIPLLKEEEVVRQIKINDETNRFFLGDVYKPNGFFPPEMAYKPFLAPIIEDLGFEWIILDEVACGGDVGRVDYTKTYKIKGGNLRIFFRERRLSNLIMSAVVRSAGSLREAMLQDIKSPRFILTAMDGETFGHHRPGLEKMIFDVFSTEEFELITVSEIQKYYRGIVEIEPTASTWAASKLDIDNNVQFLSWSDPENIIHKLQWDFTKMVLNEVYAMDRTSPAYGIVREKMDKALSSDQFFWASAKPWWSVEMIEIGAHWLLEIIGLIPGISQEKLSKASNYYEKIISIAFNWQRSGKIRDMMREQKSILRIPFRDRTLGRGGAERGVYYAFLDMMKKLEKNASKKGEYEEAILWRDAIFKLKNKLDIYDTINAIDLLRVKIPHKDVEETILKYKERYKKIRGGQPEQRGA